MPNMIKKLERGGKKGKKKKEMMMTGKGGIR